jgi:hypothetical protein
MLSGSLNVSGVGKTTRCFGGQSSASTYHSLLQRRLSATPHVVESYTHFAESSPPWVENGGAVQ